MKIFVATDVVAINQTVDMNSPCTALPYSARCDQSLSHSWPGVRQHSSIGVSRLFVSLAFRCKREQARGGGEGMILTLSASTGGLHSLDGIVICRHMARPVCCGRTCGNVPSYPRSALFSHAGRSVRDSRNSEMGFAWANLELPIRSFPSVNDAPQAGKGMAQLMERGLSGSPSGPQDLNARVPLANQLALPTISSFRASAAGESVSILPGEREAVDGNGRIPAASYVNAEAMGRLHSDEELSSGNSSVDATCSDRLSAMPAEPETMTSGRREEGIEGISREAESAAQLMNSAELLSSAVGVEADDKTDGYVSLENSGSGTRGQDIDGAFRDGDKGIRWKDVGVPERGRKSWAKDRGRQSAWSSSISRQKQRERTQQVRRRKDGGKQFVVFEGQASLDALYKEDEEETREGVTNGTEKATDESLVGDAARPVVNGDSAQSIGQYPESDPSSRYGKTRLKINLDLDLYKAKRLRQQQRFDESEEILLKCVRNFPQDGRAYVHLAKIYQKTGRVDAARTILEEGCQALKGESPYIWQAWAVLEERVGDLGRARKLFSAATVADKRHAAAWHGWGMLELRGGNLIKAQSLFLKGIKQCPSNEYLYQSLALIEADAGNVEAARNYFIQGTRNNPKSAAIWQAFALFEEKQGRIESARGMFQRGAEASPKNRYIWQAWGLFEARQKNAAKARELLETGARLNRNDHVLLQAYARFESECGNVVRARQLFKQASVADPTHQPVWQAWAIMEFREGNVERARELFQKGLSASLRGRNVAYLYHAWGVLEQKEGNIAAARELFKCALRVENTNTTTWQTWATMEENLGNIFRAEELRNLCLQQRVDVDLKKASWESQLSELIRPAVDKLKALFQLGPNSSPGNRKEFFVDENGDLIESPRVEVERVFQTDGEEQVQALNASTAVVEDMAGKKQGVDGGEVPSSRLEEL